MKIFPFEQCTRKVVAELPPAAGIKRTAPTDAESSKHAKTEKDEDDKARAVALFGDVSGVDDD